MDAHVILIVLALVCWASAAIGKPFPASAPYGIGWLGMVFWGISMLIK